MYAKYELGTLRKSDFSFTLDDFPLPDNPEAVIAGWPSFYHKGTLPGAGGSLDQDPDVMDGYTILRDLIELWKIEEQKPDDEGLKQI